MSSYSALSKARLVSSSLLRTSRSAGSSSLAASDTSELSKSVLYVVNLFVVYLSNYLNVSPYSIIIYAFNSSFCTARRAISAFISGSEPTNGSWEVADWRKFSPFVEALRILSTSSPESTWPMANWSWAFSTSSFWTARA